MLTTSHVVWSWIAFSSLYESSKDRAALVAGSIVPDIEIIFWTGMSVLYGLTGFNPLGIDYRELLHGGGISFWYIPLTHITNSVPLNTVIMLFPAFIFKRHQRFMIICWLFMELHLFVDAVSHSKGSIFFWPLRQENLMTVFDFNSQPLYIKLLEQAATFAALGFFVYSKRRAKLKVAD